MVKLQEKAIIQPHAQWWFRADFTRNNKISQKLLPVPGIKWNGAFWELPENTLFLAISIFKEEGLEVIEPKPSPSPKLKQSFIGNYSTQKVIKGLLGDGAPIYEFEQKEDLCQVVEALSTKIKILFVTSKVKDWTEAFKSPNLIISTYNKVTEVDKGVDLVILNDCLKIKDRNKGPSKNVQAYLQACPPNHIGAFSLVPLTEEPRDLWNIWDMCRPNTAGSFWKFVKYYCNHTPTKFNNWHYGGVNPLKQAELELRLTHIYKLIAPKQTAIDWQKELSNIAKNPNFEEGLF